jgi:hypothetical protein
LGRIRLEKIFTLTPPLLKKIQKLFQLLRLSTATNKFMLPEPSCANPLPFFYHLRLKADQAIDISKKTPTCQAAVRNINNKRPCCTCILESARRISTLIIRKIVLLDPVVTAKKTHAEKYGTKLAINGMCADLINRKRNKPKTKIWQALLN